MKKLVLMAILGSLCLVLWGQGIASFRNLSTKGALDDVIDLAFDPIELGHLNGSSIFSNLGNFGGKDMILQNSGSKHLLMGFTTDRCRWEKMKLALLYQYYDNKTPVLIQYDNTPWDTEPISGYGDVESFGQMYFDTNGNQLYDTYMEMERRFQNIDYSKGMDFYLNLAYEVSKKSRLGFKLGVISSDSGHNRSSVDILDFAANSPSSYIRHLQANLPELDPTVESSFEENIITCDFGTDTARSNILADLAYAKEKGKYEYRYGLELAFIDESSKIDDSVENEINTLPQDYVLQAESYYKKQDESGLGTTLKMGIRKNLATRAQRKRDAYISLNASLGYQYLSVEEQEITDYTPASYIMLDNLIFAQQHSYSSSSGPSHNFNTALRGRINLALNERTYFGSGIAYSYANKGQKGDFKENFTEVDSLFSPENLSWNATEISMMSIKGESEKHYYTHTISVPVGLEYWFTQNQKWALRFGSLFYQRISTENELYRPKDVQPLTTETYYPGEVYPEIEYHSNEYSMDNVHTVTHSSSTYYNYSIGFKPNENLQIDLMGMFDTPNVDILNTTFFRNMRLAFSLKL